MKKNRELHTYPTYYLSPVKYVSLSLILLNSQKFHFILKLKEGELPEIVGLVTQTRCQHCLASNLQLSFTMVLFFFFVFFFLFFFLFFNSSMSRTVVVHIFNPSTWEAEAGGFLSSRPVWSIK